MPYIRLEQGRALSALARYDEAETAYLRGIERDPKNVPCRTNYGLMLARLGRTAEGTLQLQAVLTPAEVHYNLASVLVADMMNACPVRPPMT